MSGLSEPIGAALGWLALYSIMDDSAYGKAALAAAPPLSRHSPAPITCPPRRLRCHAGVVFGLVAGMMVNICVKELLPTAFSYDPTDKLVTNSFIAGMAVMAMSLVLFTLV